MRCTSDAAFGAVAEAVAAAAWSVDVEGRVEAAAASWRELLWSLACVHLKEFLSGTSSVFKYRVTVVVRVAIQ